MADGQKRCRVCKVEKAKSELDATGRCQFCAMVKAATDAGMTYGKYREMLNAKGRMQNAKLGGVEPIVGSSASLRMIKNVEVAADGEGTGEPAPYRTGDEGRRPSTACPYTDEGDGESRHVQEAAPYEEGERYCPYCGKKVNGMKKYCDKTCWYGFNRESAKKRARAAYARRKGKVQLDLPLCRVCGKPITAAHRSAYCSPECAKAGKNRLKREKRLEPKKENAEC